MAVQPLLNPPLGESLLYVARRNTFAQLRQKQRVVIGTEQAAQIQPVLNPCHRVATDRQTTLLAAFAHHPDLTAFEIEVFDIQVDQFGQTQSRAVHHLQHRPIAHRQRIVEIDIQQSIDVIDVNIFWQVAGNFRRGNPLRRIGAELALADQPVEETAQRRQAKRQACRA